MRKIAFILGVVWFFIIAIPTSILMVKLSTYLLETSFKEWWVTFVWALITIPMGTVVVLLSITNKGENK